MVAHRVRRRGQRQARARPRPASGRAEQHRCGANRQMGPKAMTNSGRLDDISADAVFRRTPLRSSTVAMPGGEGVEFWRGCIPLLEASGHPLTHVALAPFRQLEKVAVCEENSTSLIYQKTMPVERGAMAKPHLFQHATVSRIIKETPTPRDLNVLAPRETPFIPPGRAVCTLRCTLTARTCTGPIRCQRTRDRFRDGNHRQAVLAARCRTGCSTTSRGDEVTLTRGGRGPSA